MSRIRIIGLALVAVFAMGAVAASAASAAEWEQETTKCEKVEKGKGKYTNSECKTEGAPNEWEKITKFRPITTPVTASSKSVGSLTLSDSGAGTTIECTGTDSGTVGAGNKDEVTAITASACKFVSAGTCTASKPVTAKAVNLPWVTELYEESGKIRDHVKAHSGGGQPGYVVECTVAGIFKVQDECIGETNTGMENVAGGVDASFDAITPKANCSIGGTGTGSVKGVDLNENPASGAIRVK